MREIQPLLDVREPAEFNKGHFEEAVNIPLGTLRSHLDQLPREKEIQVYCASGQRSYIATRILLQKGFRVKNISGGWTTYKPEIEMIGRSPKKVSQFVLERVA
jgi:rhodanese-related sulfurtransferase